MILFRSDALSFEISEKLKILLKSKKKRKAKSEFGNYIRTPRNFLKDAIMIILEIPLGKILTITPKTAIEIQTLNIF